MITRTSLLATLSLLASGCLLAQNYRIVNANSGKVLDVTNQSTDNGTAIQQWDWWGGANQQWQITPLGNGYNQILSVNSGKVLDVTDASTNNGAVIQQWDWWSGANQQWQIVPQESSYNAIFNLNSGKVLDVTGFSTDDGGVIQQYDWLGGLNQQWQIEPVQDTYQTTGQTNMYYDSYGGTAYAVGTVDVDYSTMYYYGDLIQTQLYDNGTPVASDAWGYPIPGEFGYGNTYVAVTANPGDYYEARSQFFLSAQYTWQQVDPYDCYFYCSEYYDPFNYNDILPNPEGTYEIYPNLIEFGSIQILPAVLAAQLVFLGQNGDGVTAPGNRDVFDLKFRAFIPPAWVRGPDTCVDSSGNIQRTIYAGDNRGYNQFSSNYRSHAEAIVSAATGTYQGGIPLGGGVNPYFHGGVSTRYANDALAPDGYTLYDDTPNFHDCHYTDNVTQEDSSQMFGSVSGGSGAVTTNFNGSVGNAGTFFGGLAPPFGYNVTFTINTNSNPFLPPYSFDYSHKCYPAYEAYIGSQFIYGYKPISNSILVFPLCLAGGLLVTGTVVGAVQ